MNDRTANKYWVAKQHQAKAKDETNITSFNLDEFNLNAFYLSEIGFLMSEWRLLNLYGIQGTTVNQEYYDRCIKILDSLLDLLSPKIPEEEEERYNKLIRQYEKDTKKMFKICPNETLMINRTLYDKMNFDIRAMYRKLLRKLQEKGMLTKVNQDPSLALTEMD